METITIGPKVRGYSTTLALEGDGFRISIGHSTSGLEELRRRVVSGEAFGLQFVLTDQEKVEKLFSACKRQDGPEARYLLASFIPEHVAMHPELFAKLMTERFEAGVREGRRQKAREFRKVLEEGGGSSKLFSV